MKTRKWSDLRKKGMTPERDAAIRAETESIPLEMSLREIRKMFDFSQDRLSEEADLRQASISALESGGSIDAKISTVRKYVEGLGGQLDLVATFGDKTIKVHGI